MVRKKSLADLESWLGRARSSLVASFANGVIKDQAAVSAAITLPWSNGQTEGQITKLKLVKRQMYGRGKLDLLQARGRPAASFARRLLLPVSKDTLLRVVRRRGSPRFLPPTVIGIGAMGRSSAISNGARRSRCCRIGSRQRRRIGSQARINPEASREYVDVPELRIIDDALWQRVKDRQTEIGFKVARNEGGNALNRAHRRKFLLSGLLTCGCCGSGYTIVGKDAYGCRRHRGMGNCSSGARISRTEVERRIMTALKEKLIAPDLIAEFTRAYQEEVNRLAASAGSRRADRERQLKTIERKIQAIMEAVEKGLYSASMNDRMRQLEAEREALQRERETIEDPSPIVVHPNLAELYRRRVADLEQLLLDPELGSEAMDLIRSMITEITVMPREGTEGVDLELAGDLARILHLCSTSTVMQNAQAIAGTGRLGVSAYEVSVVAGT
jgi:Recombinase zinc beta ribbon domain